MVTVRTCTDLGTIPNTDRNEFSTSYPMYIVCLLLLLWLQSGRARTWEPSPTRLVTSSPPATLCTLFIVVVMVAVRTCTDPGTIPNTARNEFSTSYTCGSRITYRCNPGYTLLGNASLTCRSDGNFHGSSFACV